MLVRKPLVESPGFHLRDLYHKRKHTVITLLHAMSFATVSNYRGEVKPDWTGGNPFWNEEASIAPIWFGLLVSQAKEKYNFHVEDFGGLQVVADWLDEHGELEEAAKYRMLQPIQVQEVYAGGSEVNAINNSWIFNVDGVYYYRLTKGMFGVKDRSSQGLGSNRIEGKLKFIDYRAGTIDPKYYKFIESAQIFPPLCQCGKPAWFIRRKTRRGEKPSKIMCPNCYRKYSRADNQWGIRYETLTIETGRHLLAPAKDVPVDRKDLIEDS